MAGGMDTIDPIVIDLTKAVFFENEKHIGFDPADQAPIFWGSRPMRKFKEKLGPDGKQEFSKHPITGQPLIGLRELDGFYDDEHIYKKVDDNHGNGRREDCEHPDVLWAKYNSAKSRNAAEQRGRDLLAELGSSGLTADEIKNAVLASRTKDEPVASPAPIQTPEEASQRQYPFKYGPGLWYLSADHEKAVTAGEESGFRGTRNDAEVKAQVYGSAVVAGNRSF